MGYYTRYSLDTYPDRNWLENTPADELEDYFSQYNAKYLFEGEGYKWYDHQEDMKVVASKYPNVLFVLSGEGEESGDIWREYYLNDKFFDAQASIVFPAAPDWAKELIDRAVIIGVFLLEK